MKHFVVRRAIKAADADTILGYELLFEQGGESLYGEKENSAADTIASFLMNNSGKIFKDKQIFLTFTPALLLRNTPKIFQKDKVIIQISDNLIIHPLAMSIAMLLSVDATFSVVKMASFKEGLARFRAFRREAEARISELVESGSRELADEMRARFEHDLERYRASFAARMGRIVRANPSITARSSEVRYQLDVLNEWTKARKDLKARYKAEMKALDDENIAKLRGGRR